MLAERRRQWIAAWLLTIAVTASPAAAITLDGTYATIFSFGVDPEPCPISVTQVGTSLTMGGSGCSIVPGGAMTFSFSVAGTIDPGTGVFTATGTTDLIPCSGPGAFTMSGTAEDDERFAGSFTCVTTGTIAGTRLGGPLCGNGTVDAGEDCDGTACCSASCHTSAEGTPCLGIAACVSDFACVAGTCTAATDLPADTPCNTDADLCTPERCDGAGTCQSGGAPPDCGPCAACVPSSGCRITEPRLLTGTCGAPTEPSAKLAVTDKTATATTSWNLGHGPAIAPSDLGSPTTATDWELCIYGVGELGFDPVLALDAPAGSGWRAAKGGFRFQQDDADGRTTIQLKPGAAGKSKVKAKRKGALPFPGMLNLVGPPFVAEVRSDDGACFGALFDVPRVHTASVLRASGGHAP